MIPTCTCSLKRPIDTMNTISFCVAWIQSVCLFFWTCLPCLPCSYHSKHPWYGEGVGVVGEGIGVVRVLWVRVLVW